MKSNLNRTFNKFRCVGTLYESALKMADCKVKPKDDKGNELPEVDAKRISGRIRVKTAFGVQTFNCIYTSIGIDGKEARNWKMAQAMMDWNPQLKGNHMEPPTLVDLEGYIDIDDYPTRDGKVASALKWNVSSAKHCDDENTPNQTMFSGVLYIGKIVPEVKDEDETGRLIMTCYGANRKGECFPVRVIVEEDLAESVEDSYAIGDTAKLDLLVKTHHVGGDNNRYQTAIGGGRKGLQVNSGYDVQEITLFMGSLPIEEPDEKYTEDDNGNQVPIKTDWIDPDTMKMAIRERDKKLKELEAGGNKSVSSGRSKSGSALDKAKRSAPAPRSRSARDSFVSDDDNFDEAFDNDDNPDKYF